MIYIIVILFKNNSTYCSLICENFTKMVKFSQIAAFNNI
jgi:hypothetical protein